MGLTTVDSSVLIPALHRSHVAHQQAMAVFRRGDLRISGHVLLETYSALTGGQVKPRARPDLAVEALLRLPNPPLTLSPDGYLSTLRRCAQNGVVGGAIYDALIAATAGEAGARLVSRDRRAARTYEVMGAGYELIV
jgi:predicted nucleic acid-binding protein